MVRQKFREILETRLVEDAGVTSTSFCTGSSR